MKLFVPFLTKTELVKKDRGKFWKQFFFGFSTESRILSNVWERCKPFRYVLAAVFQGSCSQTVGHAFLGKIRRAG
jgi:hypothetical protein